ncbi:hypothetical protein ZWY2020_049125 [Hordeum vulgare]|nr:hypothetical protein ZWY2020_049125 [Hordeum vulgare]
MPTRWQVWGRPDGSHVWIPAPDPDAPPRPAAAPPLTAPGRAPGIAAASFEDAPAKGEGASHGCRVESMADLLVQVRNKLLEEQPFGDVPDVEGGLREMDAPFRGTTLNYFLDNRINQADILFTGVGCFLVPVILGTAVHASNAADNEERLSESSNGYNLGRRAAVTKIRCIW